MVLKKRINWTPGLIKRLRGQRTRSEFGELVRVSQSTVWRWEAGKAAPDKGRARRLQKLAERERFLHDWKLVGSVTLVGDLEEGSREIARLFQRSLTRTARFIATGK